MLIPVAIAAGLGAMYFASRHSWPERGDRPDFKPDVVGESTGFSHIDKILPELRKASESAKIPLGVLVGWIAKESGGRLARYAQPGPGDTSLDERGYFQLLPEESDNLKLQHAKLSTDPRYSINGGLALIGRYMGAADKLDVAPRGTAYFWKVVKALHSLGPGQMKRIVDKAKAAGKAGSWDALSTFAQGLKINGPQPKKWFPFVDEVFAVGKPFGTGAGTDVVGGVVELPYPDIIDPLDALTSRT